MKKPFILLLLLGLTFVGCEQWKAERLVGNFLDDNLKKEYDFSRKYNDIDSTFNVTDSMVDVLRQQANKYVEFNTPISYEPGKATRPLIIERVRMKQDDSTQTNMTFYLDKELTRVVAFKEN